MTLHLSIKNEINNTRWIYKKNEIKEELKNLNIDKDILNILINRGLDTREKIEEYLYNNKENIYNPFEMADMEKAVKRLLTAIEKKEKIWIYGDYDVDGITSTSISYLSLKKLGADVNYYIPLRDEGYGLNNEALSHIKNEGGDLVITVDCGISSIQEAEHAKNIGIDLIITDHHEITGILPEAYAIINPKREDQLYSFKYLAGVGTVFLLLMAIYERLGKKEEIFEYLDIVAIGTVADIVPLQGQNRILVKEGLELLKNTNNTGLKTLLPAIFENYHEKEYNSYDIGFIIAPIFNAAGRLEDAKMAVELLTTPSSATASLISTKLIAQNNERKEIQQNILIRVEEDIEKKELWKKSVIISYSDDFHHGVIGIVASKIVDKYYKPTIIMEVKDKNLAVASCRSIEGFNILEALNSMKELFIKYGGHAGAAGFSIDPQNINEFDKRMNQYTSKLLEEEDFMKPVKIDKDIILNKVSYEFFQKVEELKPFGFGNPNPVFTVKNSTIDNIRIIGKDKSHMMMDVGSDHIKIKNCVWFSGAYLFDEINKLKKADIAFKMKLESYKNKFYPKLYIEDIKKASDKQHNTFREYIDIYNTIFPINTVVYSRNPVEEKDKISICVNRENVYISKGNRIAAFIDDKLAYSLQVLKFEYNFNFEAKINKVVKTDNNYQIFINISRNYSFNTLAFKESDMFKEIKKFLIGSFPYNSLQKKVLNFFFKKGKNVHIKEGEGRGLKTIYLTIAIFHRLREEKVLLVSDEDISSNFLKEHLEISKDFKKGYDIYIFHKSSFPDFFDKKALIYSKNTVNLENLELIEDSYEIPENIKIINEDELYENPEDKVYSPKLPLQNRINIIKKLKENQEIFATKDILKFL